MNLTKSFGRWWRGTTLKLNNNNKACENSVSAQFTIIRNRESGGVENKGVDKAVEAQRD